LRAPLTEISLHFTQNFKPKAGILNQNHAAIVSFQIIIFLSVLIIFQFRSRYIIFALETASIIIIINPVETLGLLNEQ
jgi:hypothetical protein